MSSTTSGASTVSHTSAADGAILMLHAILRLRGLLKPMVAAAAATAEAKSVKNDADKQASDEACSLVSLTLALLVLLDPG